MEILKNANIRRNLLIGAALALVASAAFGLGRLSLVVGKKEPIAIEGYLPAAMATSSPFVVSGSENLPEKAPTPTGSSAAGAESATYVGSKNGTSYYFPWCGIVKRIKPANLVYFNSKVEAEKAGYKPGNCPGLK